MKPTSDKEILFYKDINGKEPFTLWLETLDKAMQRRIWSRMVRIAVGNYGDVKPLQDGVSEFRFHFGSGYRVYFAEQDNRIIILLCGGDKKTQPQDIQKAVKYWKDYKDKHDQLP